MRGNDRAFVEVDIEQRHRSRLRAQRLFDGFDLNVEDTGELIG